MPSLKKSRVISLWPGIISLCKVMMNEVWFSIQITLKILEILLQLLSNSCKTRRNTAKDEQKYEPIFLLVFTGSRVTKSQVY